jgi:hypothetical protein
MKYVTRALACALVVLGLAASGAVGQDVYTGTVTRIDQPARVIIFDDGRMYRVAPSTVLLVDDRPMVYSTLQPGARVMVRAGEPVMYRDGQYVVVHSGAAMPASTTTTVTTVTPPAPLLTSASGVVGAYDPRTNVVTLTDGRMVQLSSKSAILINGHPSAAEDLYPGTPVVISAVNPVMSRDGRTVILNPGFYDMGSSLDWDAKYSGYEATTDNAAMQPQAS